MTRAELLPWAYPLTFWLHLSLVSASVILFALRGAGVLAAQAWPMRPAVRWLSVGIDVLLLGAGTTLWALLQLNPLQDLWLGAKLVLLLVYIVLGSLALKRASTRTGKLLFLVAALACIGFMASIALAHHPLGWWAP